MFRIIFAGCLMFIVSSITAQQKVIQLYSGAAPGSESWTYNEKVYHQGSRDAIVYDVSHPTLTVFPADPLIKTGTAVIVCPGGGFFILEAVHEGTDVAKWLNQKGVTVFLLKYRLGHSITDNPL